MKRYDGEANKRVTESGDPIFHMNLSALSQINNKQWKRMTRGAVRRCGIPPTQTSRSLTEADIRGGGRYGAAPFSSSGVFVRPLLPRFEEDSSCPFSPMPFCSFPGERRLQPRRSALEKKKRTRRAKRAFALSFRNASRRDRRLRPDCMETRLASFPISSSSASGSCLLPHDVFQNSRRLRLLIVLVASWERREVG